MAKGEVSRVPGSERQPGPIASSWPHLPAEAQDARDLEIARLRVLLETARVIGGELGLDRVMALIVERTSLIMDCERSSLFLLDSATDELYSMVAEGLECKELRFPLSAGLIGHVARNGQLLNVPDAYQDERFNPEGDRRTGFRTRSVLAMPLFDRKGSVFGVLECLNHRSPEGTPCAFDASGEDFLAALAGLAAIFLENAKLYREMDGLLESVVSAVSRSIDDRDPCTSGHSRRVTLYALNLARAVHESQDPPFDRILYTRERLRQFRYASLLHDVGKIGVREHVLCKADKLPLGSIALIQARLQLLCERRKTAVLERAFATQVPPGALLAAEYDPLARQIAEALTLVEEKNHPGRVTDADLSALSELRAKGWITDSEFESLSIRVGNLTPAEWEDMRSHVTKSYLILSQIPWPKELSELPEVAYTHHEKRDGSGYPRGLRGEEIHFDGHVMCVADIFDALTASDRPYKTALPLEVARRILLEEEAAPGRLLPQLVRLFFDRECFKI